MKTIAEVIALEEGAVIDGLSGTVKYIFPVDSKPVPGSKSTRQMQRVIVMDGDNEVFVNIYDPEKCGGEVSAFMKGGPFYAWSINKDGHPSGLTRGKSAPSKNKPGVFLHQSHLDGGQWGITAQTSAATKTAEPVAPPVEVQGDLDAFETAAPVKPEPAKEPAINKPKIAQKSAEQAATEMSPLSVASRDLAKIVLQYDNCLGLAYELASKNKDAIGSLCGEGWTPSVIHAMAELFYRESTKSK